MKRYLFFLGVLVMVAVIVWLGSKVMALPRSMTTLTDTLGPPPACEACASATQAAQTQEKINLSALQAKALATADILQAQNLATANAAATTQSAAETPAMLNASVFWGQVAVPPYRWQADTLATASAADVTQSAMQAETNSQHERARLQLTPDAATQNAAAAQQTMDPAISGTDAVIAITGLQAQSDITQKPEPSTALWMWLTPVFILAAAVLTLWGISRWQAHRPSGGQPGTPR